MDDWSAGFLDEGAGDEQDGVVAEGTAMTGPLLEALDAVVWDGLETGHPTDPVETVPQTLRQLARAGAQATEEDCYPLYSLVTAEGTETPSAAAAALPFVIALAADPAMGARVPLVDLLADLQAPALAGADWSGARALLRDPEPAVRRAAIRLAEVPGQVLERWRVETDPTVRVALLLALGEAVAGATAAGGTAAGGTAAGGTVAGAVAAGGSGGVVDEARAVLADVLAGDDPVLWVAAVHASAEFDRDVPVRQLDRLVEVLGDRTLRAGFEEVWYTPGVEEPWAREDLVRSTSWSLTHDQDAELAFAVRLIETAHRTGDAPLAREALDVAWRLLTERRSAEAALLPWAGRLLADPDAAVRLRAANLLAALGRVAAPYADRLAELLDDEAGDPVLDGTVGAYARWALARIGDPRALPGLVGQLRAQEEEQGRSYVAGDPRRPEVKEVLVPLRAHAPVLLPEIREAIRQGGPRGSATHTLLAVLGAWGADAAPALPDLLPLLADTWTTIRVIDVLRAMGPAAAGPALHACGELDTAGIRAAIDASGAYLDADRAATLRSFGFFDVFDFAGGAVTAAEQPGYGPVGDLAEVGLDAVPAADRGRPLAIGGYGRVAADVTRWSIAGPAESSLEVLEEFVLPIADGDDSFGLFREALHALIRRGETSPAIRGALTAVRASDRRLSARSSYERVLDDQELRALVDRALAGSACAPDGR
ncbi:hypothetical protein AB0K51_04215 [Kitasatospora sp. NPDC049285]|uniref:hypothetical protein n=1 Tax=Kitasatospora sp. NPDC049285 TaxID=3157096 RepID=UPI00343F8B80